jgi:hypothetical protein
MKKRGRPTKYRKKYSKELIAFFDVQMSKTYVKSEKIVKKANGTEEKRVEYGIMAEDLPTLEKFARKIKVNDDTLVEWAAAKTKKGKLKYPEFSAAYKIAKNIQKEFIVQNGLKGFYPSNFAIFVATNFTDMKDQQAVDHTTKGKELKPLNVNVVSFKDIPKEGGGDSEDD